MPNEIKAERVAKIIKAMDEDSHGDQLERYGPGSFHWVKRIRADPELRAVLERRADGGNKDAAEVLRIATGGSK